MAARILGHIRRMFLSNLPTKMMALVIAILLWTYLDYSTINKKTENIPFRLQLPQGILVRQVLNEDGAQILDSISVELEATRQIFSSINLRGVTCVHKVAVANLTGAEVVNETIVHEDFNLPEGVSVKIIPSDKIRLVLVPLEEKRVTIALSAGDCQGKPAEGYVAKAPKAVPDAIRVKLPADKKDSIREVAVEPISIEGKSDLVVVEGRIKNGADSEIIPLETFRVEVPIVAQPYEKELTLPVQFIAPPAFPYAVAVEPKDVRVRIEGPKREIEEIAAAPRLLDIFFRLDRPLEELKPGQKFNCRLEYRFAKAEHHDRLSVEVMPREKDKEIQVEITAAKDGK